MWTIHDVIIESIGSENPNSPPLVLLARGFNDERSFPVRSFEWATSAEWRGELWTDDGSRGPAFTVRAAVPEDAIRALTMEGVAQGVPLPVDLIRAIVGPEAAKAPSLYAVEHDDGTILTVLLDASTGMYMRFASEWWPLITYSFLDGRHVHDVGEAALHCYDELYAEMSRPRIGTLLDADIAANG